MRQRARGRRRRKGGCEAGNKCRFHARHRRRRGGKAFLDRGDGTAGQAARDDEVEITQVRRDVQRDAMHRDAPADADAEGADLRENSAPAIHPDADGAVVFSPLDCQVAQCGDDGLLEPTDVAPYRQTVVDQLLA